jgi:hypothetical protein
LQDPNLGKLINDLYDIHTFFGPPWAWLYGSWIYNYLAF